uniref:non-specific serine/threonine protein kinase n=1 Tax=Mesocestoides corti TaxID=53468 RepID=A0A5K3EN24_MESCO
MVEGDETFVDVAIEDPDWFFNRELKQQNALETDPVVTFECEVSDRDAEVQWFKNDEPIVASDKYEILSESRLKRILKIKNITMDDDATYTCKVAKKTTSARLVVKPDVEFKQNLIDTNGIETKSKELVCRAYNPKKYPVKWYKDGVEITFNDRISTKEAEGSLFLIIKSLELDDEGVYSCKIGAHETKGKLGVTECEKPPTVDLANFDDYLKLKKGAAFATAVPFKGFPVPNMTILRNGDPLPENVKLKAVLRNGAVAVELDDAQRADAGNYTIKLANSMGEAEIPFTIDVYDRPKPPKGPLDVCELTATKCTLMWDPPEDDGGCPITHYEVEVMDVTAGDEWKPLKKVKECKCDVPLVEGNKYKFRCRAVNQEGPSDYLEAEKETLARDICDPPDPPGNLKIADYDAEHVDLNWVKPRKENGAPVKNYIIETRKHPDKSWVTVKETPDTKASIPWKEGETYEYRVIAVNKAGKSDPCTATAPIIAKPRFLKPWIDKSRIQIIKLKVGQPFEINLRYRAEPDPEVKWFADETPMESNDEYELIFNNRDSGIKVNNAQRKHTRLYKLVVSNEVGFDEATVEVVVLGKPTKPRGPLEVKEVTKNSCVLEWKPPSDDGGEPIQYYLVEKMDTKKGRWEKVAEVTRGTTCTVPKLIEGNKYDFRVSAVSNQGASEPLEAETETIAKNPYDEPEAPEKPEIVDHDKDRIDLKWQPPAFDGGAPIIGYHVERKEPKSSRWTRVTLKPVPDTNYIDGSVTAGREYEYRVIAVNKAGPSPPSKPSDLVTAKPSREAPKLDKNRLRDLLGPRNEIRLRAGEPLSIPIPIKGAPKPTVTWTKDGGAVPMTAKLTDTEELAALDIPRTVREETGKYKIHLSNEYGEDEAEISVIIMDKPKPPRDLEVFDVFAEHCMLKWKPPEDDGGTPITDYIVERCSESLGVWEPVSGVIKDNQILVKGLQPKQLYQFRVKAVNNMGESAPAQTKNSVLAKNPFDPPSAPQDFEIVSYDKRSVSFEWKPPKSDGGNAIKGYQIEKRLHPRGDWKVATNNLVPGTKITLSNVDEGMTYEFRVCAVNDGGPGAYAQLEKPHTVKDMIFPPESPRELNVDSVNKNGAKLSWKPPKIDGGAPVTGYVVEKQDDDGNWVPVLETKEASVFVPMKEGEKAQLRVRAVNREGPGEPTRPTPVITAEDKPTPPRIATISDGVIGGPGSGVGGLQDVTIKAGQELRLPVAWFGYPKPTASWLLNEKPVKPGENNVILLDEAPPRPSANTPTAQLEQEPGGTFVLLVPNARRVNTGRYQVRLINDQGQATSSCQVNVIDVPGSPTGPLEAVDVKADEITLQWKPPEDDGGEPITNYVLEKRAKGSESWQKVSGFLKAPTATVHGLEVGQEYEFRVMAENVVGVSEPLQTTSAIKAKHPFDPPSGMEKPDVEETTETSVSLSWKPPRKGPVTGYIVEKRLKGEHGWTKANSGQLSGTAYTVKNLPTGKEFQFRIIPYNLAGQGEPSEPTDSTKIQNPPSAPKVSKNIMTTINAVVDKPFTMHIPYTGTPPDNIELTKDGKVIPLPSGRFMFQVTPDEVIIMDTKAVKEDAGRYSVSLINDQGKDDVAIQVNIRGPPSAPIGPLEITNVRANSCTLSWSPPDENGGAPITNYVVEKQEGSSSEWTPVSTFVRMPQFDVSDLTEGKQYRFRVRAANEFGPGEPLEGNKAITTEDPIVPPGPPGDLEISDVDADSVKLRWTKPRKTGNGKITGYIVEYKPALGGEWTKGTGVSGKDTEGTVSGLEKGEKYLFRVSAKNEAGVGEPVQTSRPVLCKPKYDAPDAPGVPSIKDVDRNFVELVWTAPSKDGGARITGYIVEKKQIGSANWEPAISGGEPITGTAAKLEDLVENADYEFRVRAVNAAGPGQPSLPTEMVKVAKKKVTPDAPEDVTPTNIMANSCTLKWKPPKDDGGSPITDYVVEKLDESLGVWSPVRGVLHDNSVSVTDLVEGKRYLFRVSAVNAIGQSEPAETLTSVLAKNPFDAPDAPTSAKVIDYDRSSASISWQAPERDGGSPIIGYLIEKRVGKGEWIKALPNLVSGTEATIPNLLTGKECEFRVAAVNAGGPGDFSRATQAQLIKDKTTPAGSPDGLNVDKVNKNGAKLSWKKPRNDGGSPITGYVVEKLDSDGNWAPVKQTTEPEAFIPMKEGEKTQFRVRAINEEGEGEPSRPTPPVTAEDQPAPPRIITLADGVLGGPGSGVGGLQDITIKAGQELRLPIAWFGHPPPTVTWIQNGEPVSHGGDRKIMMTTEPQPRSASQLLGGPLEEESGGTSVLRVPRASRVDSGQWQVLLKNELGQATSSCKVTVIDVPDMPKGPLEATDVKADEISLSWKPPEDNGGEPVTNYVLEKRPKGSGDWQKVSAFIKSPTATVRGLEEGVEYEFRVMAENAMGLSEPLMTDKAIKAKHPFDPPSGMQKPIVEGTTENSVSLSWEPPQKGPVSGYIIEKRPKGERNWAKAHPGTISGLSSTIRGLPTNKEFQFRVVPINAAGHGEPSEPSETVTVREPPTAPRIGDLKREVNATLGEPFKIHVPYTGTPPDTITLTKDGKKMDLPSGSFAVEVTPDEVIIMNLKAEKDDEGQYEVALTNEKGKDQVAIKVNVKRPPESPTGPLEATDITAEGCTLKWKPPKDNGGSPITNYVVEKQDLKTGEWSPVSNYVRGTELEVSGLDEGKRYNFRVKAVNENGASEPLESNSPITAENPVVPPGSPSSLEVADVDAEEVTLSWVKPRKDGGSKITGYTVEYKPASSDDWIKAPSTKDTMATVNGLRKGEKYVFRVSARNAAGVGEPCSSTRPVVCKPKYDAPDAPGQPRIEDVDKNQVTLSWSTPVRDGGSKLTGYIVEKKKLGESDWSKAANLPATATKVTVDGLEPEGEYEFRVRGVNAAGPGNPSLPSELTKVEPKKTKPKGPDEVSVRNILANSCKVEWTPPLFDGGLPITGYAVEVCDEATGVWSPITSPIHENSVDVQGLAEGHRYMFRVAAINALGRSEPTETHLSILAKNPFDNPDAPQSVKIDDYDRNSVALIWKPPERDGGNPIKGYLVEKRTPRGQWVTATPGLVSDTKVTLTGLEPGREYEFRVAAVNDGGPGDFSRPTMPHIMKDKIVPASSPDGLNVDKVNKNGAKLSWKKPRNDGGSPITGYVVEKLDSDGNWAPVKQTTEPEAFIPMKEGEKTQFRVRAINEEGEGEPSRPTPPVTAEDQPAAPRIANSSDGLIDGPGSGIGGLKDITVKAGQEIRLALTWFASPAPTARWIHNDKPVSLDGERVKATTEDAPHSARPLLGGYLAEDPAGTSVLVIKKAKRTDAGQYGVLLENPHGQTRSSCTVTVLDAPGAPRGPLEAVDIKADEVTLKWSAPEDDGGEPVKNYILEKRIAGTDNWQKVSAFLHSPEVTVRNLDEGKPYEFRVMAENSYGVSEPLTTNGSIRPKHPFDPPSGMSEPYVTDSTDDSVTLSWNPPTRGPVSGYIVEKKPKGSREWTKANVGNVTGNTYTVKGLPTGNEYEFRVVPYNAAGNGEPSNSTGFIKVQKPIEAPKISIETPTEINTVFGQPLRIRVPFTGSPPSSVELTKDGKPVLLPNTRLAVEITPDEVIISTPASEKDDTGVYDIKISNQKGSDHRPIKINVLCPPEAPVGPLDVSNVTANSCKLRWKPPAATFGAPVTNYIVERQDVENGDWSPVSKFVRHPEYEVTSLDTGKKYKFRVSAVNEYGVSEPLEGERTIIAVDEPTVPDSPQNLEITDVNEDSVSLEWVKPRGTGTQKPTGYIVEYKTPDGEWTRATVGQVKGTSVTVPGLEKGKRYMFRVSAKNDAGIGEPSRPTPTVECKPKYTTPGTTGIPSVDSVGRDFVNLSWTPPTRDGGSRITSYVVEKRQRGSSDWLPATTSPVIGTSANISGLPSGEEFEFRVIPVNTAGSGEPSQSTPMTKIEDKRANAAADFITKLSPASTGVGGTAEFTVQVDGNPMPRIRWLHNGMELNPTGRIQITGPDADGVARLVLSDLTEHDAGDITCELVTPVNRIACSAPLDVFGAPQVFGDVPERTVEEGDLVKFKVPYTARGNVKLKLYKDGREVPESKAVKLMDLDGVASVQMKDIDRSMAGQYTLDISNESGTTSVPLTLKVQGEPDACQGPLQVSDTTPFSTRLSWRPPRSDGGSKITHYVVQRQEVGTDNWVTVQSACRSLSSEVQGLTDGVSYLFRVAPVNDVGQGEWLTTTAPTVAKYPFDKPSAPGPISVSDVGSNFVNLTWSRPSNDGGGRLLGYFIEKREAGATNWTRVNLNPIQTLSYNLPNLLEDKSYEFRVIAVNDAGESPPSSIDSPVVVKDPQSCAAPQLLRSLKPLTVNEGRDAEFEIEVDCSSPYDVTWYKGDRELVPSNRIDMSREGRVCTLTIANCHGEDTEEYGVRVSNRGGTKYSRAPLSVNTKPQINLPERWREPTDWERGDTIQIKAPFVAHPAPKATWTLNGKELKEGKNVQMEVKRRHAILTLSNVDENTTGKVTLTLENSMGADSATIDLKVHDRPPPPFNVRVEGISDGRALLSWNMPPDSGYVSEYIIERAEGSSDNWVRAGISRFSTYYCDGLQNGHEYRFRVYADNLHGRSDPSKPSDPTVIKYDDKDRSRQRHKLGDGEPRGSYDGPPISDYDRFYEGLWRKGAPLPTNFNSGNIYDYYEILEELGSGSFGVVHRAKEKATGRIYVVKFVPTPTEAERAVVNNEANIMKLLNHPKLMHLHEVFSEPTETAMVLEFLSGGELFDRIADDGYTMSEAEVIKYVRQLLSGLQHMHENHIVHLDIKPENIMCETSRSTDIKLVDFGLSTKLNPQDEVRVSTATPEFSAPEIADHNPVGFYTDMWAVGVLTYILLSGISPFAGDDIVETLSNVSKASYNFDNEAFRNISDNAKDFISKLLVKAPEKRMNVFEALEHPWLNTEVTDEQNRRIPAKRYETVRRQMHERIGKNWEQQPPIGHLSNYSSIRRLKRDEYKIYTTQFDRREAGPRFIRHPSNQTVLEGNTAQFNCRVIGVSEPIITWVYRGTQLTQSLKYMQRYSGRDYSLKVSRVKKSEDEGEYIVRAENSFGRKESSAYLTVEFVREITREPSVMPRKKFVLKEYEVVLPEELPPRFSLPLRNRFIQAGRSVKLTCTADGNPTPQLSWFKDGRQIERDGEFDIQTILGITSIEIFSCSDQHSGRYTCRASNKLGEDETTCKLVVEPNRVKQLLAATASRGVRASSTMPYTSSETYKTTSSVRESSILGNSITSTTSITRSSLQMSERRSSGMRNANPRQKAPALKAAIDAPTGLLEGDTLTLEAQFYPAEPPATVAWFFNGQDLSSAGRTNIMTSSDGCRSTLRINDLSSVDSGSYECKAMNPAGIAKTRTDVSVSTKGLTGREFSVPAANDVTLAEPVPIGSFVDGTEASSVEVATRASEVDGDYEPDAASATPEHDQLNGAIAIQPGFHPEVPILLRQLQGQIVDLGVGSVTFSCQFKNATGVGWSFNGKALAPDDKYDITLEGNDVNLVVKDIGLEDSGVYACHAVNTDGRVTTVGYLSVRDSKNPTPGPQFLTFPNSLTTTADRPIELDCSFTSPVTSLMLCQNMMEMEEAQFFISEDGLSAKISLAGGDLIPADSGKYAVIAQNADGDHCEWWFDIQVKPADKLA